MQQANPKIEHHHYTDYWIYKEYKAILNYYKLSRYKFIKYLLDLKNVPWQWIEEQISTLVWLLFQILRNGQIMYRNL